MMFYRANLQFGADGTITVTYRALNFTPQAGLLPSKVADWVIRQIPITLVPPLPGGATPSTTQAAAGAGQPAGGEE